jgi:hypothetical protein
MPDTAHTSLAEGLQFFHLRVRAAADKAALPIHLMLSDRAGEAFTSVRDKPATSTQLIEVTRADRIVILLDGKRVANPETRGNATQGVRKLLRALIDGSAITNQSDVQILLTKKDLIANVDDPVELQRRVNDFFQLLTRDFASRVGRLTFFEVAARDPSGKTTSGLDTLLKDWLAVKKTEVKRAPIAGPRVSEFDRLLDRAGLKYLP